MTDNQEGRSAIGNFFHVVWNGLAIFGLTVVLAIIATVVGLWHVFHGVF